MFDFNENSKVIIIPEGVTYIPDGCFKDNKNVEEIILPSSINHIGMEAFCGCTSLKKINLPEGLMMLDQFSFAGCSSLEEITIPKSLHYIDVGVFGECINLKSINLHDDINYIENYSLYNCHNLTNFSFPKNISSLGISALSGCNSIESIYIPPTLTNIESGALSLMKSLEKIIVDKTNPKYISDNNLALIEKENGSLIQYAINSKNKVYKIGTVPIYYGNIIVNEPIYNICDYAFAGCKYLEELHIDSTVESFAHNSFFNCPNLKKLIINHVPNGDILLFNLSTFGKKDTYIPFEEIFIGEGITTIAENINSIFENAVSVILPSTLTQIGSNVFSNSTRLLSLNFPKGIKYIAPKTFYNNINLIFETLGTFKAKDFNMLKVKTSNDYYIKTNAKDDIKIFSLNDGTYYVGIANFEVVKITKDEINSLSKTSYLLENDPDVFIKYLNQLLNINNDYNHIITSVLHSDSLKEKFDKFVSDIDYVSDIAVKKNSKAIHDILEEKNLNDEILFNGLLMRKLSRKDIITIITNMNNSLERFFKFSNCFSSSESLKNYNFSSLINDISKITNYCNLLEKYKQYDRFLYNPIFVLSLDLDEQEKLIKNYNSNLKRLLINSGTLGDTINNNSKTSNSCITVESNDTDTFLYQEENNATLIYTNDNLQDLLKLCEILGVFSDNKILSQKACNFITEKMFLNKDGLYKVVNDDIHRIFNEIKVRDELDLEFILLFVENYKELIDIEKNTSGFISRVYNNFKEIYKSSSSNTGEQRHLKVTVNKCKDYFLMNQFSQDIEEDEELVSLLGKYFSDTNVLTAARFILEESKLAPRNIFTKRYENNSIVTYDNNPDLDLKGHTESGFSYEWLPKQSLDNLILGKYCNCCAHIKGNGAGIMRASMILDSCQNLVIRNCIGEIIAKSTIYINKDKGYGVFNTVEGNLGYRSESKLQKIYTAYKKGYEVFIDEYNKNNPDSPLHTISVGMQRNILAEQLENNSIVDNPLDAIDYSKMQYAIGNTMVGNYKGDSKLKQKYLIKNKK